jgi:acylphosphatase
VTSGDARARVTVRGRVQGVFFRAETRRTAEELSLSGWVANRADGAVEAVFEGERSSVESAVDWCRTGPPASRVDSVDVEWEEPRGEAGFRIRYG